MSARGRIELAFRRLAERPGFVERENQTQLALFLSDLIEGKSTGAIEAPTGLGKSLAALIPAIAHAIESKTRIVVATYTNVLAEQYWDKDLPLALSLFDDTDEVNCRFLIGRQRYACLMSLDEHAPDQIDQFRVEAKLGIESEFRRLFRKSSEATAMWQKVATPPVCPARLCPAYDDCFYYSARKRAEKAQIVITNHSVVIQDGLMARAADDSEGLLGKFDFLILDEAHDFVQAAMNGLEFELSAGRLNVVQGVAGRLASTLLPIAQSVGQGSEWTRATTKFKENLDRCSAQLAAYSLSLQRPGILMASPNELFEHPHVQAAKTPDGIAGAERIANELSESCSKFLASLEERLETWSMMRPDQVRFANETIRNYVQFIRDIGGGAGHIVRPEGSAISYVGTGSSGAMLRQDLVDFGEPLTEMIWSRTPYALLSATLAVDGEFEFLRRTTGATPDFEEVLPSPFDYSSQAALYMPKAGRIPDPTTARREGREEEYYDALAYELNRIVLMMGGRTLALFHSRKEMEAVYQRIAPHPELPIYMQLRSGASTIGEKFKKNVHASLFALRSFWTGFDAPGETLSCVALVRVPFEVPIDPPAIARLASLQNRGVDPFQSCTLPMAKMMIRQGAGRLIRSAEDRGLIALLDPRIRGKRYGEEIVANLPPEMRAFDDLADAVGWIGLDSEFAALSS